MSVENTVRFISMMIIRTMGPNCVNRDDLGNFKSTFFGNRERRRISSQCNKRHIRKLLNKILGVENYRTQEIPRLLKESLETGDVSHIVERLAKIFSDGKTDGKLLKGYDKYKKSITAAMPAGDISLLGTYQSITSLFISQDEYSLLLEEVKKPIGDIRPLNDIIKGADRRYGAVIALFGRFMAEASDMTLEAACSFAHEISTHEVMSESDYFILENEKALTTGGGHLGHSSFGTATTYLHAVLDMETLRSNLPGFSQEQIKQIVGGFVQASVEAFPEGRKNSFFANTLPEYVRIDVTPMPISMVSAFEEPVSSGVNGGYTKNSIKVLEEYRAQQIERGYTVSSSCGGDNYKTKDLVAFVQKLC